jgi:hypothetical protein
MSFGDGIIAIGRRRRPDHRGNPRGGAIRAGGSDRIPKVNRVDRFHPRKGRGSRAGCDILSHGPRPGCGGVVVVVQLPPKLRGDATVGCTDVARAI